MADYAPIALFVFARPTHTKNTLAALRANPLAVDSDLIVFSDGPRGNADEDSVAHVRRIAREAAGFRTVTVVERECNLGLSGNIISGVTDVCREYGKVIVLEDDLLTSQHFLAYMNEALEVYKNDSRVASVHGYAYPTRAILPDSFFLRGADCWGWATWNRAWDYFNPDGAALLRQLDRSGLVRDFDFDGNYEYSRLLRDQVEGRSDSWAARWYASAFLSDMLSLHPGRSLVHHVGADGSGTNVRFTSSLDVYVTADPVRVERQEVRESQYARSMLTRSFRRMRYLRLWYVAVGLFRALRRVFSGAGVR